MITIIALFSHSNESITTNCPALSLPVGHTIGEPEGCVEGAVHLEFSGYA
jgi:hypothetical protein